MLLAFSVIFVLAYVFIIRTPPQPPVPDLREVTGAYTWTSSAGSPAGRSGAGAFTAVAAGDAGGTFRPAAADSGSLTSRYEAASRTESTAATVAASPEAGVTVGSWPPAWRLATRSPLDYQGLSAVVRAAVEDGDTAVGVKPLEQEGRKVWRAAIKLDGSTQELVVDQASGLVTWWTDGTSTFVADVDWGAPAEVPAAPAADAGLVTVDRAYSYELSLAAAGRAAGFEPLASGLAPDGFAEAAVATAEAGEAPASWDPTGAADGPRQIAQLFTRGLTWFEVRQLGPAASTAAAFGRAVATARATALSFEQAELQYGVFAGHTASTWYAASGPALLAGDGRRAVYVTGALTRQELVSFAEGLKPLGAGEAASPAP